MSLSKQELRKQLRRIRNSIDDQYQESAAIDLATNVQTIPYFKSAQNIALYWPHDGEISTLMLMQHATENNKKCFMPILRVDYKQKLAFASYTSNTPVIKNRYDILEPELGFASIIELTELNIIFTPLVGFDRRGHRLGRGGGFYDATFAELKNIPKYKWPKLIGLGYDCQKIDNIPDDTHDWQLDYVVTESQVYDFS